MTFTFLQNFLRTFFSSFFASFPPLFNLSNRPPFESGCKCTTFTFSFPNFLATFFKVFFRAFFLTLNQSLTSTHQRLAFQSGCKSRTSHSFMQAFLKEKIKKSKNDLYSPLYILRCSFCVFEPVAIERTMQLYLQNSY